MCNFDFYSHIEEHCQQKLNFAINSYQFVLQIVCKIFFLVLFFKRISQKSLNEGKFAPLKAFEKAQIEGRNGIFS